MPGVTRSNRMVSGGANQLSLTLRRSDGFGAADIARATREAQRTGRWAAFTDAKNAIGDALDAFQDQEANRQAVALTRSWNRAGAKLKIPKDVPITKVIGDLGGRQALGRSAQATKSRAIAGAREATSKTEKKAAIAQATAALKNAATTSARTAATAAHNDAVMAIVRANADKFRVLCAVAVLDDRTTDTCMELNGAVWDVKTGKATSESMTKKPYPGPPPWHWNCRTQLVPVLNDADLPTIFTVEDWIKFDPEEARAALGADRISLWKRGRLPLSDLVRGMKERPLDT